MANDILNGHFHTQRLTFCLKLHETVEFGIPLNILISWIEQVNSGSILSSMTINDDSVGSTESTHEFSEYERMKKDFQLLSDYAIWPHTFPSPYDCFKS